MSTCPKVTSVKRQITSSWKSRGTYCCNNLCEWIQGAVGTVPTRCHLHLCTHLLDSFSHANSSGFLADCCRESSVAIGIRCFPHRSLHCCRKLLTFQNLQRNRADVWVQEKALIHGEEEQGPIVAQFLGQVMHGMYVQLGSKVCHVGGLVRKCASKTLTSATGRHVEVHQMRSLTHADQCSSRREATNVTISILKDHACAAFHVFRVLLILAEICRSLKEVIVHHTEAFNALEPF